MYGCMDLHTKMGENNARRQNRLKEANFEFPGTCQADTG